MDVGYSSATRARVIELMLAEPGSDRVNWYLDNLQVGSECVIFLSEEAPTGLVQYCSWAGREPEASEGNQGSRYTQSLARLYTYNYGLNNVLVAPVVSKSSASITVRLNFGRFKPVGIFQDGQRLDWMDTLELDLRHIYIDPFNRSHHGPFTRSERRPVLSYDDADA